MNLNYQPIYVLNVSGGHGNFLCYLLDRFCTETPNIDTLPFNKLGASHLDYKKSGKFIFIDDPKTKYFLLRISNSLPPKFPAAPVIKIFFFKV